MSERRPSEKEEEKRGEKEEKEEEKGRGREEKWRRDRGSAVKWASILIWGALVLLAETTNLAVNFIWWNGWAVFFAGAGVIVLLVALIRLLIPEHRRPVTGSLIFGFILLGIGLGGLLGWSWIWPIVLIAIAVVILLGVFVRRR